MTNKAIAARNRIKCAVLSFRWAVIRWFCFSETGPSSRRLWGCPGCEIRANSSTRRLASAMSTGYSGNLTRLNECLITSTAYCSQLLFGSAARVSWVSGNADSRTPLYQSLIKKILDDAQQIRKVVAKNFRHEFDLRVSLRDLIDRNVLNKVRNLIHHSF